MRKMIVAGMVSGLMISMASAATNQVYSKNAVGFVKVDVPGDALTIVSAPFNTMSDTGVYTLDELIGTNMTAANDAINADMVYMWAGNAEGYKTAYLNAEGGWYEYTHWRWCDADTGEPCASNVAFNIMAGQGFWIDNKHESRTLYFMGEVPSEGYTTNELSSLMMIANPYPVEKILDDMITTNDGAHAANAPTSADEIYIWVDDSVGYKQAYLNAEGGWYDYAHWRWCDSDTGEPCASNELFNIKPGQGFWYKSVDGSFEWKYKKPYDWP